ncbi:MAG: hypothetical protein LAP13_14880 [Acidobacteriia bacterium]|nr:hypothetical protein [Terriglobia bacterium]
MRSIVMRSRVGPDGMVHLDVPSGLTDTEVEVIVILHPIAQPASGHAKDLGWSPGFFESVIGGWHGEPLERENERAYETREEL